MRKFFLALLLFCPMILRAQGGYDLENEIRIINQSHDQTQASLRRRLDEQRSAYENHIRSERPYYVSQDQWDKDREVLEGDIHSYEQMIRNDESLRRKQIQDAENMDRALKAIFAQQKAQQEKAERDRKAREEQEKRTRQEKEAQIQRAKELEAKREAERVRREQEMLAMRQKYDADYNRSIQQSNPYYAEKKSEANWMASSEAMSAMRNTLSENRLERSLDDAPSLPSGKQVTSSVGIERLKNRKNNADRQESSASGAIFDETSLFSLSTMSREKGRRSIRDEWPYPSRIPLTSRERDPLYDYEEAPDVIPASWSVEPDVWDKVRKNPSVTEEKWALLKGTIMNLNNGMPLPFSETRSDGGLVFGEDKFFLAVSPDLGTIDYVELVEHDYRKDNIVNSIREGKPWISRDAHFKTPMGVSVNPETGGLSVGKTLYTSEYRSSPKDAAEKDKVGGDGSLKLSLVDDSSTLRAGRIYVWNNYAIGVEGSVTAGTQVDAKVEGELSADLSSTNPAKATLMAKGGVEALDGQLRVFVNAVDRMKNGKEYSVTTRQVGGGFSLGLMAKYKVSKSGVEAGAGPLSARGFAQVVAQSRVSAR